MVECIFPTRHKGATCPVCGFVLGREFRSIPHKTCDGPPCKHLRAVKERAGVPITVKCSCSGADVTAYLPVYGCALFHRCLPSVRFDNDQLEKWRDRKPESDIYSLCFTCEHREAVHHAN